MVCPVRVHVQERDILIKARESPWLTSLEFAFQDAKYLYLGMELISGGDLQSLTCKEGVYKEEWASFYIAEIIEGVQALHKLGFIHRDLKPDNILIEVSGHIKLCDFGSAVYVGEFIFQAAGGSVVGLSLRHWNMWMCVLHVGMR